MGKGRSGASLAAALAAALALPAAPARAEWVEWIADADLGAEFTDNLNRSAFPGENEEDVLWSGAASLGRTYQLGDRTRLSATADLRGELFARFDRLDALDLGATLSAFHKLGLGDRAPWLRGFVSARHHNVREDARDSWLLESGLALGKRFTPRLDASLSYTYRRRDGRLQEAVFPGFARDVFDQDGHELALEAGFLVVEPLVVFAGAAYYAGDFDAVCPRGRLPNLAAIRPAAVGRDPVFRSGPVECIYRIDGDVTSAWAGATWVLGERTDVELRYRFDFGDGRRLQYETHRVALGLAWRY